MTFEERLAELGVDLSDLPKNYRWLPIWEINKTIMEWSAKPVNYEDAARVHYSYIQHLTDIIDRMETRIVNLTGERDYLRAKLCYMCRLVDDDVAEAEGLIDCFKCDLTTVPEDWSVDNG